MISSCVFLVVMTFNPEVAYCFPGQSFEPVVRLVFRRSGRVKTFEGHASMEKERDRRRELSGRLVYVSKGRLDYRERISTLH